MINGKKDALHLMGDDILELDLVTYTNVGVAKSISLPTYCEPNSSIKNGFVEVFNNDGEQLEEISMAEIDDKTNVGKFAVDSTNTIYFIVDKTKITDLNSAKKTYQYFDVVFKMKDTTKIVEGQYLLTVYDKLQKRYIYKSIPCDENKKDQLIKTLLTSMDLNSMGILKFEVEPIISE